MFFRKQPEPEPEPEIVVEKSEQLDGEIGIHIRIPSDLEKLITANIKTVDGELSEISLGTGRYVITGSREHIWSINKVYFKSEELQPLVKALNALLAQIHWIENGQTKTEQA